MTEDRNDVVNLNKFRKRKKNEEAERAAAENRVRFGRTKAAREANKASRAALKKRLDQSKLDED